MSFNATMTNAQSLAIGVTILDRRGNKLTKLPAGASIEFSSSDPAIVSVAVRPDGMNADLTSEAVGTATITVTPSGLNKRDGTPLEADSGTVEVTDAEPDSLNTTVGEATDE